MFARTYYETFMRYEPSFEVFVAMPFTRSFQGVYTTIIEPAIRRVKIHQRPLDARIVNRGTSGAPDIHEQIYDAIIHSRLVLADMTVQSSYKDDKSVTRWQPNSNVAYEVGLATAWRNPEDIILLHQAHEDHSYSFDVQNLRHVEYHPDDLNSIDMLTEEMLNALRRSSFLAARAFGKIVESLSAIAIQFMYLEAPYRAFPVIAFTKSTLGITGAREHAASELLACGALKNTHVINQGDGKGVAIIYRWTKLGLRLLSQVHAVSTGRIAEMESQIASVPAGQIPPRKLLRLPDDGPQSNQPDAMPDS